MVKFFSEESCGQCTPCREGTGWLWRMVDRIEHGQGTLADLDKLNQIAENIHIALYGPSSFARALMNGALFLSPGPRSNPMVNFPAVGR